jgi:two-component system chemotaxis sensor kinase CheA
VVKLSENSQEPLLDMFIFETAQLLEQLEQLIIDGERSSYGEMETINEIFRIMHTIKGSSAMMNFVSISEVTHSAEDLFHLIRQKKAIISDCSSVSDIILESIDFIKAEIAKIESGDKTAEGEYRPLTEKIREYITKIKIPEDDRKERPNPGGNGSTHSKGDTGESGPGMSPGIAQTGKLYKAVLFFEDGCQMESVRAYMLVNSLKDAAEIIRYFPGDLTDSENSEEIIRKEGFQIWFSTERSYGEIHNLLSQTIFLKDMALTEETPEDKAVKDIPEQKDPGESDGKKAAEYTIVQTGENGYAIKEKSKDEDTVRPDAKDTKMEEKSREINSKSSSAHHNMISVNVAKLDKLMDLIGELVISEAMVTQSPDLDGLSLERFQKAARQHRKIIDELQDTAMSIRMVPLSATFQKMNRIIRDMGRKLNKEVRLELIGEETEVDKNIIEHISDPLMHLIRNSMDHGLEPDAERRAKGKPEVGTVTLEAKNAGGDVMITVRDDGRGLDRERILAKARANGLISRPDSELQDKEIYSFIFLPGFSTKEKATEFSGRGVGMDVVSQNISAVGGSVSVDSKRDEGTAVTLKIPLTLAIMDGMTVKVGGAKYTIPIISIRESFKPGKDDVFTDPEGNEMTMIRGECYPVIRLHRIFNVRNAVTHFEDGIMIVVENEGKAACVLADELIGEQQVVVKALPDYIKNLKKIRGVAGCTLLGDGSISLILDAAGLLDY